MDLYEYVERFGNLDYIEKPFNDVEAAILIVLSYANFEGIVPSITEKKSGIKFSDLTEEQIDILSTPKTLGSENHKLITLMRDLPRYRDIVAENTMCVVDEDTSEQFFAMTFNIPNVGLFIAYRGTDGSLIGWKENMSTLYNQATLAQIDAIEYLYQVKEIHPDETFILGGHSKGGNLSMYSLFFSDSEINKLITKVYSFDGYGFTTKKFRVIPNYNDYVSRLVQIVPRDSIIGEVFYTPFNYTIIAANGSGIAQHHPFRWILDDEGSFVYISQRSFKTRLLHRVVKKWSQFSTKNNYKVFVKLVSNAFQGENGEFNIYGEGSEHKLKKLRKAKKGLTFKEKLSCDWMITVLILITIYSLFYYAVMKICIMLGMKRHKHRGLK